MPRKSYREYHADLYPPTAGCVANLGVADWITGKPGPPARVSLDPAAGPAARLVRHGPRPQEIPRSIAPAEKVQKPGVRGSESPGLMECSPKPSPRPRQARGQTEALPQPAPLPAPRPAPPVAEDEPDLRRQPSIRDRLKMFETWGDGKEAPAGKISARLEKRMDIREELEENKENKPQQQQAMDVGSPGKAAPAPPPTSLAGRPRTDPAEPFLYPVLRPAQPALPQSNRLSKFGRVTKFRHMKGSAHIRQT